MRRSTTYSADFQRVFDVLPEGIIVADARGRVIMSNRAAREIVGRDVTGRSLPEDDTKADETYRARRSDGRPYPARELPLQRTIRDEVVHDELVLIRHNTTGRDTPLLVNSVPLHDSTDAAGMGDGGEVIVAGAPVSMGREAHVTEAGEYRFFAGWRSDPFFFDAEGALHDLQFTGSDFFADKDVCSIALEVPNSALGSSAADGAGGCWAQADRCARPAQSIFLPWEERAVYHAGEPADDARFVDGFAYALEHVGGYTPEEARRVVGTLLPDVLPYDHTRPATYSTNGRTLTDDVVDVFLAVFTNGKVTEDKVGPHSDLLPACPFLALPHPRGDHGACVPAAVPAGHPPARPTANSVGATLRWSR